MDTWKNNIADVLTKKDSALNDMLHLCLASGEILIDYEVESERNSNEKNLG